MLINLLFKSQKCCNHLIWKDLRKRAQCSFFLHLFLSLILPFPRFVNVKFLFMQIIKLMCICNFSERFAFVSSTLAKNSSTLDTECKRRWRLHLYRVFCRWNYWRAIRHPGGKRWRWLHWYISFLFFLFVYGQIKKFFSQYVIFEFRI